MIKQYSTNGLDFDYRDLSEALLDLCHDGPTGAEVEGMLRPKVLDVWEGTFVWADAPTCIKEGLHEKIVELLVEYDKENNTHLNDEWKRIGSFAQNHLCERMRDVVDLWAESYCMLTGGVNIVDLRKRRFSYGDPGCPCPNELSDFMEET